MPGRAGWRQPSRVRVPSGNRIDGPALEQAVQDGFESCRAAAFAVHGHGLPAVQHPAHHWKAEEVLPGQVIQGAAQPGAGQQRVEKTGVIAGEDDRPVERHALGIVIARAKVEPEQEPEAAPAQVIDGIHGMNARLRIGNPRYSRLEICATIVAASPLQPQRGCAAKPRVGAAPTLGSRAAMPGNPNGVAARRPGIQSPALAASRNPVGVESPSIAATQGCPCGPTLGFVPQPRCG